MAAPFLSIQTGGDAELHKNILLLLREAPQMLALANMQTAEAVKTGAKRNLKQIDAYDTGTLYDSVDIASDRGGLIVVVGTAAKQGVFVEFGTRPHFPPLDPIRAWCVRKGLGAAAAYPVARKIAERGTPERPWLYPALLAQRSWHGRRIREAVAVAMSRLFPRRTA